MEPTTSGHGLSFIIERFFKLNRASDAPQQEAKKFAELLHCRLKAHPQFGEDCRVDIFGSMRSGLWTISSDVDVCVRLGKDDVDIPKEEVVKFITAIKKIVRAFKFAQVIPIICRIPIVKFAKSRSGPGVHGDISFLNEIAIYNSDLINAYSKWDDRFLILGLFVKKWASLCEIGSGQDGFPSSYAWIVMLIQFLQHTSPKVLPNIQQDFIDEDEDSGLDHIIKGHNTYFYKCVKPNWSQNKKTVGELFIDFLDYYSEYDFIHLAVQIHEKEPIKKPKISPLIVVVDPITDERIGCKVREKARFITEVIIPNSLEAFKSHEITAKKGSTLNDLEVVLKEFRKTHIGPTLLEARAEKREKVRQLALEKKRAIVQKALAAKRDNEVTAARPLESKKPEPAKISCLLGAVPLAKLLHNAEILEAKPSNSATVDNTMGLSIGTIEARMMSTASNLPSYRMLTLKMPGVPFSQTLFIADPVEPEISSTADSTVPTVGRSISEENNVRNVYDVLKIQPGDSSNLPEHPEETKKSNGETASRLDEILYLRDHISDLQRYLAKMENEELNAGRPVFLPNKSKPAPKLEVRPRRNRNGKQDFQTKQEKRNANSAAKLSTGRGKTSLLSDIVNGSTKSSRGSNVQIKGSPNGVLPAEQKIKKN